MSANTTPVFGITPRQSFASTGTSANTNHDGTGTVATAFTAGVEGSKIDRIFFQHLGSNVATVVRLFINNGSTNATPANNSLFHEEGFLAYTNSDSAASPASVYTANLILPAGYKINVVTATAIASGIQVTCEGSDF